MVGQSKRKHKAAPATIPDAVTMRTIIATVIAVFTALTLINYSDSKPQSTQKSAHQVVAIMQKPVAATKSVPITTRTQAKPATPSKPKAQSVKKRAAKATRIVPKPTCASELAKYSNWDKNVARAVMMAESHGIASKVGDKLLRFLLGGTTYGASYGCFQVRYLPGRPTPSNLLDPAFNIKYANDLYKARGWQPWSAYNTGAYREFL